MLKIAVLSGLVALALSYGPSPSNSEKSGYMAYRRGFSSDKVVKPKSPYSGYSRFRPQAPEPEEEFGSASVYSGYRPRPRPPHPPRARPSVYGGYRPKARPPPRPRPRPSQPEEPYEPEEPYQPESKPTHSKEMEIMMKCMSVGLENLKDCIAAVLNGEEFRPPGPDRPPPSPSTDYPQPPPSTDRPRPPPSSDRPQPPPSTDGPPSPTEPPAPNGIAMFCANNEPGSDQCFGLIDLTDCPKPTGADSEQELQAQFAALDACLETCPVPPTNPSLELPISCL